VCCYSRNWQQYDFLQHVHGPYGSDAVAFDLSVKAPVLLISAMSTSAARFMTGTSTALVLLIAPYFVAAVICMLPVIFLSSKWNTMYFCVAET
jgi:hypothetical protein